MVATLGAFLLGTVCTSQAQTRQPERKYDVSINAGGQFESREFSPVMTFTLFDETGTVTANQTIGGGFVFDASGGYRTWRNISVAVGFSMFTGSSNAAAIVAIPNPLVHGQPSLKSLDASAFSDLSRTSVAANFQVVWRRAVTEDIDVAAFGGPSLIHVSQEMPSVTPDQAAVPTIVSQSATTGKAGSVGVDFSYRLTPRYRAGLFVRYLGGTVDLPARPNLKIGGVQVAAGIRIPF
jgi:hypothetical protein